MNYLIKIEEKKLNIKRVIITAVFFLAFISFIFFIIKKNIKYNSISKSDVNIEKSTEESNNIAYEVKDNSENNEEPQTQEPLIVDIESNNNYKFTPLNSDELSRFDGIYKKSDPKRIFLTFDDGPTTQVTPFILDLLKQENIKASFFVLGSRVEANPDLVKREYDEGHFIANHGYSHKYSSIYSSNETVFNEYNKTNDLIKNAIGNPDYNSLVFRFPGGSIGGPYDTLKKGAKQKLREQGIASVDWNALTGDAEGIKTKEALFQRFCNTLNGQSSVVLLMHDAADKILTYEILPDIISYCRSNGYEFKSMYDIILRQ